MDILDARIADDLGPITRGGITAYPATMLDRIFDWADGQNRKIEWLEGVFYNPDTNEGQLSLSYMIKRDIGVPYSQFQNRCMEMASEIQTEAAQFGMSGYFEIGISD